MFRRKEEDQDLLSDHEDFDHTGTNAEAESASAVDSNAEGRSSAVKASAVGYTPSRPATDAKIAQPAAANPYRPGIASSNSDIGRARLQDVRATAPNTDKSKSNRRILTVGNDILLKGEIATCDRLVIEGEVDAKLNDVHTVEIAETGSFKGSAEIEDAEISGLFEGDLIVRNRLIIYASGRVRGNITYGEIEIERGGELTGQIKTIQSAAKSDGKKAA